ncbi:MAG: asparagine synthase-related protein, partial [Candidatus Thermoplasmatota archaeon]|nr:asparagine synthase-related protein [Candidatus Thermoplasmatota archaeon]
MELSDFNQKITKEEWDTHVDYLDGLPDIVSSKERTYLSLKEHISMNVQGVNFGILLSGGIDSCLIAKIC